MQTPYKQQKIRFLMHVRDIAYNTLFYWHFNPHSPPRRIEVCGIQGT
ncbi:hypothetical protein [Fluviicola sp.]